jgi:hypothetical protein
LEYLLEENGDREILSIITASGKAMLPARSALTHGDGIRIRGSYPHQ